MQSIRVRASSLHYSYLCPGRPRMESDPDCPPAGASDIAESGTAIHDELADKPSRDLEVSEEIRKDQCERQVAMVIERFGLPEEEHKETLELEVKFKSGVVPGHPDRVLVYPDFVVVVDYKTGWGGSTPPAELNLQLSAYAIGVALKFKRAAAWVAIIEPSTRREPDLCYYDKAALGARWREIDAILAEAAKPDAPLVPGDLQCKYCRARAICPAARAEVAKLSKLDTDFGRWKALTPAERLEVYDFAKRAAKTAATIERWFHGELSENPDAYDGELVIKEPTIVREVTDSLGLWERLRDEIGLTPEQYAACVKVPIGALMDAVKDVVKPKRGEGGQFKKDFDLTIAPFVTQKERGAGLERRRKELGTAQPAAELPDTTATNAA